MLLSTCENLATILPALATLTEGTTRTGRSGKKFRMYRPERTMSEGKLADAAKSLLRAGYTVKVYELNTVFTLELDGETVVYRPRATARTRTTMVVEVTLGR